MFGLVEITDSLGMDFYYVKVSVNYDWLFIRKGNKRCKEIFKTIHLKDIDKVSKTINRISFEYEGEQYTIRKQGPAFFNFFENIE